MPTKTEADLDRAVVTLNLHWLLSAQALARSDVEKARLVYGLDLELIGVLRQASFLVLCALAESGVLLFRPRFPSRLLHERLSVPSSSMVASELQTLLLAAEEAERS